MDVTAAGIAFIQISTDIVKCVIKARKLWQEIKDLPKEIDDMLSDLKVFGSVFEGIQEQLEADNLILTRDDASIKSSLKLARHAHSGLNDMIKDMEKQISSRKGLKKKAALVRITTKKDDLEKYQQRLSRTVDFLQMSIQSYQIALMNRNPEVISRLVTTDLKTYFDSRETTIAPAHTRQEATIQNEDRMDKNALIPKWEKPVAKRGDYNPSKTGKIALAYAKGTGAWQAYIQWPNWLSKSIYEVESNPTLGGWMYNYRIYNIVPSNSEIITKVKNGDTDGVLKLFQARKASPFDREADGTSLLSYAAKSNNYETCKLLLRMGLHKSLAQPVGLEAGGPLNVLVHGSVSSTLKPKSPDQKKELRRIAELFNSYLDEPESTTVLRLFDFEQLWPYGGNYKMEYQLNFLPTLYTGPLRNRIEAFRLGSFHMNSCDLDHFIAKDGRVTASDVNLSTREKLSLVHSAAVALGTRFPDEILVPGPKGFPMPVVYDEDWSELVQRVASVAGHDDLHSVETITPWDVYQVPTWRGTPLISVIGGALCYISPDISFCHWDTVFQRTLRQWILDLQIAGVDLTEYGRREVVALRDNNRGALDADAIESSRHQIRNRMVKEAKSYRLQEIEMGGWNENHWVPIRLLDLKVGPRPEDWRLEWVSEFEWMAREFWELMEKENIVMPGSWVE
ncbi:hypothetical protein BKA56DRAFT_214028 [Ilyonectria sp. MPI-CAGE-AT-0026]|nr:hypothetical protein BKA56DRAFT_214028 [Ilyonectria sp. MPI-CAGE-AT-0026]